MGTSHRRHGLPQAMARPDGIGPCPAPFHVTVLLPARARGVSIGVYSIVVGRASESDVRVFIAVAVGRDRASSDVDLLLHMGRPLGHMDLVGFEVELDEVASTGINLVPDTNIRLDVRELIPAEAASLWAEEVARQRAHR